MTYVHVIEVEMGSEVSLQQVREQREYRVDADRYANPRIIAEGLA